MKRWLILLLVLSGALTGCTQADGEKTEKPVIEEKEYAVKVASVTEQTFVNTLDLSGILAPYSEAYVSAKVGGEIEQIHGALGDTVVKDGVLMTLDDQDYTLGKNKAHIGVKNAAQSYKNASDTYNRSRQLFEGGALSQSELDIVKLQMDGAELAYSNAQLDLESALLNVENTKITAPITGVIAEQNGSIGENVGPGQTLFRIVDMTQFYVTVGVSESVIAKLSVGQKVTCKTIDGATIVGTVENISPVIAEPAKTYPVKIKIDNQDAGLRSGMSITASVELGAPQSALAVPKEAVVVIGEARYVFVIEKGRAVQKQVELGETNDTHFRVVSGLNPEDQVVVSGPSLLKNGDKIKVIDK